MTQPQAALARVLCDNALLRRVFALGVHGDAVADARFLCTCEAVCRQWRAVAVSPLTASNELWSPVWRASVPTSRLAHEAQVNARRGFKAGVKQEWRASAAAPAQLCFDDVTASFDVFRGRTQMYWGQLPMGEYDLSDEPPLCIGPQVLLKSQDAVAAFLEQHGHAIHAFHARKGNDRLFLPSSLPVLDELRLDVSLLHRDGRLLPLTRKMRFDLFHFSTADGGKLRMIFPGGSLRPSMLFASHAALAIDWEVKLSFLFDDVDEPIVSMDFFAPDHTDGGEQDPLHTDSLRAALARAPWVSM